MDYRAIATEVLAKIGGNENVANVGHCATRLRFTLKDEAKADEAAIKNIKGVVGCVNKGGQFQVVIGNDVTFVYDEISKLVDADKTSGSQPDEEEAVAETKKGNFLTKALDIISGSVFPIVPARAGGGLIKALLAVLAAAGWLAKASTTYQMLNFIGDAPFYFLPVLLGVSASKKFKVNPYLGASIGAMMISPTFVSMVAAAKQSGEAIKLFGITVPSVNYSSSIIPIMLAIWLMSYVEPFITKHMFKEIRMVIAPMVEFMIIAPITFLVLGPLGNELGQVFAMGITALNGIASWLIPTVVGALTPLLVMTGMHYGLIPLGVNELATSGIDHIAGPGMLVSNIAAGGANLAASFKLKNKEKKALAASCAVEAVCGITEPALYGISLPYRRPLYATMIGGAIGGFFLGIMNVGRYAQVPPSIFALPSFIPESGSMQVMIYAAIGSAIAFAAAFIAELILGIKEEA